MEYIKDLCLDFLFSGFILLYSLLWFQNLFHVAICMLVTPYRYTASHVFSCNFVCYQHHLSWRHYSICEWLVVCKICVTWSWLNWVFAKGHPNKLPKFDHPTLPLLHYVNFCPAKCIVILVSFFIATSVYQNIHHLWLNFVFIIFVISIVTESPCACILLLS